jgi:predicted TIM-barrel fold metal-dependent hydrolase
MEDPSLQVIDPHIHLWDLSTGLYPGMEKPSSGGFGGDNTRIARTYLLADLMADAGEVEILKAVHVEAFPTDPLREAQHVQAMADAVPSRIPQGIVAHADLAAPGVAQLLEALAEVPNVRGIRQVINRHPDPAYNYIARELLDEPAWHEGFALLKRHRLSFDLQLYPHQMMQAAQVAAFHPETPIIVNHAGMFADRTLAGWRQWREGMRALARYSNVSVKISGLGMLDHRWTLESIRPYVLDTLDAFGPERSMFASNFPVDSLYSDYPSVWQAFAAITADLSAEQRAGLFRRNAERVYRI